MIRLIAMFTLLTLPASAWAQKPATAVLPDNEAGRCRYGAEHMIAFARQSLSDPRSRPETIEKRRKLVDDWASRLEKGEDPCSVYMDIHKAATTF